MTGETDAIIFDLGGVLYNIDPGLTKKAFGELGVKDFNHYYTLKEQVELFDFLEKGLIQEDRFFSEINRICGLAMEKEKIKQAWNAILVEMPEESINLLKNLKASGYKLYLLSNTNILHYNSITSEMKEKFGLDSLDVLFDEAWYSFKIGMRKPDAEIYSYVKGKIDVVKAVFIDDNSDNVNAALASGIQAIQKTAGISLKDLLEKHNIFR